MPFRADVRAVENGSNHVIWRKKVAQNNQQKGQQKVQETSQLEKVRREKLAELQAAGKDPFQIVKYDQSYHSAQIKRDVD